MISRFTFLFLSGLCVSTNLFAQTHPIPKDVETLDGIIEAYYEIVSGPAGSYMDKERDLAIHIPDAPVIILSENDKGDLVINRMTIADFHNRPGPRETGFYEVEIHRETQQYGAMTHIWSTYEWRTTEYGPVGGQGINSIQLYYDGNRWWISSEIYDTRNKPIPEKYMPK